MPGRGGGGNGPTSAIRSGSRSSARARKAKQNIHKLKSGSKGKPAAKMTKKKKKY